MNENKKQIVVEVIDQEIDLEVFGKKIESRMDWLGCGADIFFVGRVRDFNHGKKVVGVSYDAFKPLAEKTFHEICQEAALEWGPLMSLTLLHRVGRLEVGDASVYISVTTPHRDEAFEACRYVIEQLKIRAPIWKKEHYDTGDSEWLKGHELCRHHGPAHKHVRSLQEQKGG